MRSTRSSQPWPPIADRLPAPSPVEAAAGLGAARGNHNAVTPRVSFSMMAARPAGSFLLLTSMWLSFAVGEGVVRRLKEKPHPPASGMYSSRHWDADDRGAVRHVPNEAVRMVSIYCDTIEFDLS